MKKFILILLFLAIATPSFAESTYYVRKWKPIYLKHNGVMAYVRVGRRDGLHVGSVYSHQVCAKLTHGDIRCGIGGQKFNTEHSFKVDLGRISSRSDIESIFIKND